MRASAVNLLSFAIDKLVPDAAARVRSARAMILIDHSWRDAPGV
jgi:hypothetical protein